MNTGVSQRQIYESKYTSSRMNLLLVVAFTVINMVLCLTNADMYFLFTASVPYILTGLGMFLCGKLPEDIYFEEEFNGMEFLDTSFLWIMVAISFVIVALYLLGWIFSKNHKVGWLIFSLAFFCVDTVVMFLYYGFDVSMIIDIVFHAWVIYSLSVGIHAYFKLKKLPEETLEFETVAGNAGEFAEENAENADVEPEKAENAETESTDTDGQ